MFKAVRIPWVGWSVHIQTWYPEFDQGPRWATGRGRCRERVFAMPFFGWDVTFYGRGKSYRELVGFDLPIDWILDEFDDSFNDLAIASLRYHMDYSVALCSDERRAKYTDLIERLTEPRPRFTEEELAILEPPGWTWEDDFEPHPDGGALMKPTPPEKQAVYEAHRLREDAYLERIRQARHDFVDIMPELWS
ncbi:hypothetical protein [Nocardia xishanensis]|uniref:hypothetical protein n=1 Tax=Nocardia xishanensis TaxID=238964 RepID=UPI00082B56E2|nr:hypothetical protein [Nocardia xishanensis]